MHAVFSSANDANEAARRIFNKEGPNYESITKADLTKAATLGALAVPDDDDGDVVAVTFDESGAVTIDIGEDVGEGEELKVWVTRFGMYEGMPKEK